MGAVRRTPDGRGLWAQVRETAGPLLAEGLARLQDSMARSGAATEAEDAPESAALPASSHDDPGDQRFVATACRRVFRDALKKGDVLIFSSLDELAVLAHVAERRPAYHSAIYIGKGNIVHNVSELWWRDAEQHGGLREKWFPAESAASDSFTGEGLDPDEAWTKLVERLTTVGGVGPMRMHTYLDDRLTEQLWGTFTTEQVDTTDEKGEPTKVTARTFVPSGWTRQVHKVTGVTAFRRAPGADEEPVTWEALSRLIRERAGQMNNVRWDDGFPTAELVQLVPRIAARPGYGKVWPTFFHGLASMVEQLGAAIGSGRTLNVANRGARSICAMFVRDVYEDAQRPLTLEVVPDEVKPEPLRDRHYTTPRDLWDAPNLRPVAMLVVPPERGDPLPDGGPPARASDETVWSGLQQPVDEDATENGGADEHPDGPPFTSEDEELAIRALDLLLQAALAASPLTADDVAIPGWPDWSPPTPRPLA